MDPYNIIVVNENDHQFIEFTMHIGAIISATYNFSNRETSGGYRVNWYVVNMPASCVHSTVYCVCITC